MDLGHKVCYYNIQLLGCNRRVRSQGQLELNGQKSHKWRSQVGRRDRFRGIWQTASGIDSADD